MELNWESDFHMIIEIGLLGGDVNLDIYKLRLAGLLRVEVIPIDKGIKVGSGRLPFREIHATFMKPPFIDLSVTFGDAAIKKIKSSEVGFAPIISQVSLCLLFTSPLDII